MSNEIIDGYPDWAWREAIGRKAMAQYGPTPGRSIGNTGFTWDDEYSARRSSKLVRDRLPGIIQRGDLGYITTVYGLLASDNYYAETERYAIERRTAQPTNAVGRKPKGVQVTLLYDDGGHEVLGSLDV